ncbi:MAG: septal ring lytic transglycosylase RlpA family protein, partial [Rhizobiaceae bacterium]
GSGWGKMRFASVLIVSIFGAVALAGCNQFKKADIKTETKFSSKEMGVDSSPRLTVAKKTPKGGGRYQVGKPYKIRGKWYTPKEDPTYVASGKASWYGPNFHGRMTANGEIYDQYALSAAHPTMPLPSYARVTNVENGRSVIVRVNDRGPFSKSRIIDLSSRAADLLEYKKQGIASVKVEYVGKARMDGRDEKFLMASYRDPNSGPGFWPGTGLSNTLVASAGTGKARQSDATLDQQIEAFLVASNVPVPEPRPGRSEPGIAMDLTIAFALRADSDLLSSFMSGIIDAGRPIDNLDVFDLIETSSHSPNLVLAESREVTLVLGVFDNLADAEEAHAVASDIGPASFHHEIEEGQEFSIVKLHIGADVANVVLEQVRLRGFVNAAIVN